MFPWLQINQGSSLSFLSQASITNTAFFNTPGYWINQGRTGAWWETVANFVADTFITSDICAGSRTKYNQPSGDTLMNLKKVISDSFQVIVDGSRGSGNYYDAWPFLTYITNNPDKYSGLGMVNFPNVWRKYGMHIKKSFIVIFNLYFSNRTANFW